MIQQICLCFVFQHGKQDEIPRNIFFISKINLFLTYGLIMLLTCLDISCVCMFENYRGGRWQHESCKEILITAKIGRQQEEDRCKAWDTGHLDTWKYKYSLNRSHKLQCLTLCLLFCPLFPSL